jgi:hypothetical protein
MPKGQMTEQNKMDLEIIKMRGGLHKDRFYKGNDGTELPKYFQMGKIIDDPADYYSTRIPKKQQKRTILEELQQDAKVKQFAKKRYSILQAKEEQRRKKLMRINKQSKKKEFYQKKLINK